MTERDALPVLRLTGEQIGSITPEPDGDWFVDFDEYEEFVPKRLYDAALATTSEPTAGLDVERLGRALDAVPRCQLSLEGDEHHVHRSDAERLAAEYARPSGPSKCVCCEEGFYCRHRCAVHPKPHGVHDSGQPWAEYARPSDPQETP